MSVVSKKQKVELGLPVSAQPVSRADLNNGVYSSLSEAISEIERRRKDSDLERKLQEFLGSSEIPSILSESQNIPAVLFRQLASPNYEMRRFLSLAELGNLSPVVWEYLEDKYVTSNPEKYSLGKLSFYHGMGKKGGAKITRTKAVDLQNYNGKKISDVRTLWGESLVDFHHRLLSEAYDGKTNVALFDASNWFKKNGARANHYYEQFLSLFIKHGLLFENFLLDGSEREFTENVFFPAFERVKQTFGVKPLIVALDPTEVEEDEFWRCYPPETERGVNLKIV